MVEGNTVHIKANLCPFLYTPLALLSPGPFFRNWLQIPLRSLSIIILFSDLSYPSRNYFTLCHAFCDFKKISAPFRGQVFTITRNVRDSKATIYPDIWLYVNQHIC